MAISVQFLTWATEVQLGKSCMCYLWALVTRFHALQLQRRLQSIRLKIPTWNPYVGRIRKLEEHSYFCISTSLLWVWKGSGGKMRRMQSRKFAFISAKLHRRLVKAPGWDCSLLPWVRSVELFFPPHKSLQLTSGPFWIPPSPPSLNSNLCRLLGLCNIVFIPQIYKDLGHVIKKQY